METKLAKTDCMCRSTLDWIAGCCCLVLVLAVMGTAGAARAGTDADGVGTAGTPDEADDNRDDAESAGQDAGSATTEPSEPPGPDLGNPRVAQRPEPHRSDADNGRALGTDDDEVPPEPKLARRPRSMSRPPSARGPRTKTADTPAGSSQNRTTSDEPSGSDRPILDSAPGQRPQTLLELLEETSVVGPGPRNPKGVSEGRVDLQPSDPASQEPRSESAAEAELPPETAARVERVRRCLNHYFRERIDVSQRSPWGLMHAMLAFGAEGHFHVQSKRVNAVSWLCHNGAGRNQRLFYNKGGRLHTNVGPGVQGHDGQFLAMLAQLGIARESPIQVDGRKFTVQHLVEYEMRTCRPGTELTFKLIGLAHYLDSNATWKTDRGDSFDIPRLIRDELAEPVVGAACGGTHRLMGFARAVRTREARGEPIEGQWRRAQIFLDSYHEYTFGLQNPDGSFSTNWFEGRGAAPDDDRRLQTTGHILEWLVFSLSDNELDDPRLTRCVDYLATLMLENRNKKWEIGPRGHALRALLLYDRRVIDRAHAELPESHAELAPDPAAGADAEPQPPKSNLGGTRTAARIPETDKDRAASAGGKKRVPRDPFRRDRFRRD